MTDPDEDKWIEALPILSAKITTTHKATIACIEFQTREGRKLFLVQRHGLLEIGQAMLEFSKDMPHAQRPS